VSQKNDTDVAHCKVNSYQPILVIFGKNTDDAKTVSWQRWNVGLIYTLYWKDHFWGSCFPR